MRLSKFLAHSGYCSRREAEQFIQKNKVIINGDTCNDFSYQVKKNDEDNNVSNNNFKKVGRNEKCPCGSGKKYKKCCGSL